MAVLFRVTHSSYTQLLKGPGVWAGLFFPPFILYKNKTSPSLPPASCWQSSMWSTLSLKSGAIRIRS